MHTSWIWHLRFRLRNLEARRPTILNKTHMHAFEKNLNALKVLVVADYLISYEILFHLFLVLFLCVVVVSLFLSLALMGHRRYVQTALPSIFAIYYPRTAEKICSFGV